MTSQDRTQFYQQLSDALAALKQGKCHTCLQSVEFIQDGQDVKGSCGHKLYRGTVAAFQKPEAK